MRRVSRVLVLCYHAISEEWPAALSVTPVAFRRQLETLLSRGWTATTFTHAVTRPVAQRTLAVTFDDAFDSVRTRAAPVLAEMGIPATVFVPTDWPGRSMRWPGIEHWAATPYAEELRGMTWDGLRELAAHGWEIGSHTCSHPRLTQLDDAGLRRELGASRAACERELGGRCRSVAYPYGDADARTRAAAEATGYVAAAGLGVALPPGERYEWPRVGIWHGEPDWRIRVKTSRHAAWVAWRRNALAAARRRARAANG